MTRRHGHPPGQRQLRVGEEIRHALAHVLERGDIRDPDLAGRVVTVTEVRVSPDLRNATVFFTPLGGEAVAEVRAALKRVKPYLRHELGRAVRLRCVPELSFEPDTSFDVASHIDRLLHDPAVARDLAGERGLDQEGEDDGA